MSVIKLIKKLIRNKLNFLKTEGSDFRMAIRGFHDRSEDADGYRFFEPPGSRETQGI